MLMADVVECPEQCPLQSLIRHNVQDTAHIVTDQHKSYVGLAQDFASHHAIDHSKTYVRGVIHTNFAESYFSLLKRGLLGTFHHVSHKHMQRYLTEFEFRWNRRKANNGERAEAAIIGARGKRLMYRGGMSRTFPVPSTKRGPLQSLIRHNVQDTAHIVTDQHKSYVGLAQDFASHHAIDHSKTYVRGVIHTNFAESYFSLLKRGLLGTFHHVSHKHMQRYLTEFEFRWNRRKANNGERAEAAIIGARGKRLMYRAPVRKRGRPSKVEVQRRIRPSSALD